MASPNRIPISSTGRLTIGPGIRDVEEPAQVAVLEHPDSEADRCGDAEEEADRRLDRHEIDRKTSISSSNASPTTTSM